MPLLVGIDEAGYGPLLGPLVVGASVWRVQPAAVNADLWKLLNKCISRAPVKSAARIPVGDSKQTFDRKRGICTLERSVLAFAQALGLQFPTLADWLHSLGNVPERFAAVPWYRNLSATLPRDPAGSSYEGVAARLRTIMEAAGVTCVGLHARVLTEDYYNSRVEATRNKAAVLLEPVFELLNRAVADCNGQDVHVVIDRLGGRMNYDALLMQAFPDRHLHVLEQTETRSRYRLATQQSDWFVEFVVDADQRCMPVSLASMIAKYCREALMEQFNAFWQVVAPDVRPTAGYRNDAQRFLRELGGRVDGAGIPSKSFIRWR